MNSSYLHPRSFRRVAGFTLIELLIVLAILGILMGLMFPVVSGVMESARRAQAKTDLVNIVNAIKSYYTEYGRMPTLASGDDADEATMGWFQGPQTGGNYNNQIVRVLLGEDYQGLNPRKRVFLEERPAKPDGLGGWKNGIDPNEKIFYDPWGTPYAIKVDVSYDGRLEYYDPAQKQNIFTSVLAVSFGKNKVQQDITKSTDKDQKVDDIVSFQ
jgi:prepilin-type N-terminal cleavage/methylation domain-containing protein